MSSGPTWKLLIGGLGMYCGSAPVTCTMRPRLRPRGPARGHQVVLSQKYLPGMMLPRASPSCPQRKRLRATDGARQLMTTGAAGTSRPPGPGGRVRVPPPLIRTRLPSGRGATEQPNAAGDGDAALTPVFWVMVALTGVAAGLFGDLMMLLLFSVQHLAFGYHAGSLEAAVSRAPDLRRLVVLLAAGA